jgi:hypothetical protein
MIEDGASRPQQATSTGLAGSWAWAAAFAYFTVTSLAHLQFSLWLVRPRETPWGTQPLAAFVPHVAAFGAALLAALALRQIVRSGRPWALGGLWCLWALAVLAVDRWLTFSANEYFHYPQYALLAWLVARSLDPRRQRWIAGRALFWTTLLGAADELLQYLWITTRYSHYFDVNDVLVNFLAAAAGVLLHYRPAKRTEVDTARSSPATAEVATAVVLTLGIGAALSTGRLQLEPQTHVPPGGLAADPGGRWILYLQRAPGQYGSWQTGPHRGLHYVARPSDGALALAAASVLIVLTGRRVPASASPRP